MKARFSARLFRLCVTGLLLTPAACLATETGNASNPLGSTQTQVKSELSFMAKQRAAAESAGEAAYKKFKGQICGQLNTKLTLANNPFVYTNPDAGCNLGLSMPGLPNIGASVGAADSCKLLKSVTGNTVDQINKQLQSSVDNALKAAGGSNGNLDYNVDLGSVAQGVTGGQNASSGQETSISVNKAIKDASQ